MTTFTEGDVIRYDSITQPSRWCREETAIAERLKSGEIAFFDTYWGTGSDAHRVTADELATAELQFNLADYDEFDRYDRGSVTRWSRYAPADRQKVTSQHGLQARWFVRKGSIEDITTQIENARADVLAREADVQSAQRRLAWAQEELAALESTVHPNGSPE